MKTTLIMKFLFCVIALFQVTVCFGAKSLKAHHMTLKQKERIFKEIAKRNAENNFISYRARLDCLISQAKIISGTTYFKCTLYDVNHEDFSSVILTTKSEGLSASGLVGYSLGYLYCLDNDSNYFAHYSYSTEGGAALGIGYLYNYAESYFCSLTLNSFVVGAGASFSLESDFSIERDVSNDWESSR